MIIARYRDVRARLAHGGHDQMTTGANHDPERSATEDHADRRSSDDDASSSAQSIGNHIGTETTNGTTAFGASGLTRFEPPRARAWTDPQGGQAATAQNLGATKLMASVGAVVATMIVGASATWLATAMARIVATVVYGPEAWKHGVWASFAIATGVLGAHRYGGTATREGWLLATASVLFAFGAGLGASPSLFVPELVHSVVIATGWALMGLGVGVIGGIAIRRSASLSALSIGAVAAGSAVAFATGPALVAKLGAPGLAAAAAAVAGVSSIILACTESIGAWANRIAIALSITVAVGSAVELGAVATLASTVADPGRVPVAKSLFASVASPEDEERHDSATWGPSGRFDVTVAPNGARWLYLDGVPYGVVAPQGRIRPDGAILPFVLPGKVGRVLVVGLGGGQEVRAALEAGATSVVVAEPHSGAVHTVKAAHAAVGGPPVLNGAAVRVVDEEARAWLRSGDETFDLILITLASFGAVSEPGRSSGATLLTREAIAEYIGHLSTDGTIAIRVRDDHELWRAFNTAFQAMADVGAPTPTDAIRHLLAVNDGTAGGTLEDITLPTIFVRKSAFTQASANDVLRFLLEAPFPPLFIPYSESRSVLAIIGTEDGPATAEAGVPYDISPARDDRPYFQEAGKGLPWSAIAILVSLASGTAVATWASAHRPNDFGELAHDGDNLDVDQVDRRPVVGDATPWRHVFIAAFAGLSAGSIGSVMLWRLPMVAGRADLTNAAGAAAMAVGGLAAALVVHRTARSGVRAVAGWGALLACVFPFIISEALPLSSSLIHGRTLEERIIIGATLLVPVGFGLGAQLPALLRLLAITGRPGWEALIWGATIASTAAGTALAQVMSRVSGDTLTATFGAGASLACFLAFGLRWVKEADVLARSTTNAES